MTVSQDRLKHLLASTESIFAVGDKFFAMVKAANEILHELALNEVITVGLYFQEKAADGKNGYALFQMSALPNGQGFVELQLDQVGNIQHEYYQELPNPILEIIRQHERQRVIPLPGRLLIPMQHEANILGVIDLTSLPDNFANKIDIDAIATLAQFLSIFLDNLSLTLEQDQKIKERTKELNKTLRDLESTLNELEQKNTALTASYNKLEDLNLSNQHLLKKLGTLHEVHLKSLQNWLDPLLGTLAPEGLVLAQQTKREISQIEELLRPIAQLYFSEKAIANKRVLLAETDKKQQIIAKMALGGTGVNLDIVSTPEEGMKLMERKHFDILFVNHDLIEFSKWAHEKSPQIQIVFMTSIDAPEYIRVLLDYPHISNIVSRNNEDRTFTLKNIITTASKLMSHNLFGLEKYLSWGVEINQLPIEGSEQRKVLIKAMEEYFEALGVRRALLSKCASVAEELLMNAVYDAPTKSDGVTMYNHLSRTQPIQLSKEQFGTFRFACDGLLVAISAEDPFGALSREIILEYLSECYQGKFNPQHTKSGGAGRGLFQIMEMADLLVMNVKPKIKTEVIAIFNIDPNRPKSENHTSFHYFSG